MSNHEIYLNLVSGPRLTSLLLTVRIISDIELLARMMTAIGYPCKIVWCATVVWSCYSLSRILLLLVLTVLVDTLFHQTYLQFTLINLQYIQLPKRLVNMNSNDYHDYHDKRKQLTTSPKFEKAFSLTRLGIFYLHSKFGAQEHSSC